MDHEPTDRPTDATSGAGPEPGRAAPDAAQPAAGTITPATVPVDLRDYVDFSPDAARRVRVFATARLAVDLWCIEPRQATPVLHLADHDVTYTVLGGRSWFVTDDGEVGLDALGALLVPAGTVHGIDNRAPDPLIVLAVSSPPDGVAAPSPVEAPGPAVRRPPTGGVRSGIAAALGRVRGR
jgi:quercetin dioxygenase-like cupin family protein